MKIVPADKPYLRECGEAVTEEDAEFLFGLALLLRPTCIAEIGTGSMRSLLAFYQAKWWLKKHLNWNCHVWSCDTRLEAVQAAWQAYPNLNVIQGDVSVLAEAITHPPELVFLDGPYQGPEVSRVYGVIEELAAPGATLVLHDTVVHEDIGHLAEKKKAFLLGGPCGMGLVRLP